MSAYIGSVTHDVPSNTLEVVWLERGEDELKRVKCRNYSAEQKSEFLSDCGPAGEKYVTLAGW